MSAVALQAITRPRGTERYAGRSESTKAALIRAEVQLISRFLRAGCLSIAWRCHVCGGRVDISGATAQSGRAQVTTTRGKCRTPNCLDWED